MSTDSTHPTPVEAPSTDSRAVFYRQLLSSAKQQLSVAPSREPFALMANLAALIYHSFRSAYGAQSINWAGFYLLRRVEPSCFHDPSSDPRVLLLGPFHGQPAVSLIRIGRGVCGTAVVARTTQVVPDVHAHPNHIACDSASASEIVVPIFRTAAATTASSDSADATPMAGVLDIDSPTIGFFGEEDRIALETVVSALTAAADWRTLDAPIEVTLPEDDTCLMNRPVKPMHH